MMNFVVLLGGKLSLFYGKCLRNIASSVEFGNL